MRTVKFELEVGSKIDHHYDHHISRILLDELWMKRGIFQILTNLPDELYQA